MAKFVLTAQMQLQAPTNLTQVRRQIQQQLGNVTITPVINTQSLANANKQLQNTAANAAKASANLKTAGRSAQSLGAALGSAARRFAAITLATGFFLGLARGITEAFSRAVDFEKELLKISQVTGKSMNALKGLTSEVTRLSTSLGVSSTELLNASRTLAQAGFSAQKTKQALEVLARTDLAATFDNLADTTEGAIAILRQFRGEARAAGGDIKFLSQAMDAINSVSKSFAVESADLIAAVRRTGGVFEAAGGKLNELIALFTSVRATTRETAETIATGFRTIFTRIQRSETIEQLRELGIELRTVEGEFVGPLEAIKRLQVGLAGLSATDYRFQEIIEQLGGFRQVGKVIPLLKQYDTTVQALAIANMSAGSTARDAETAQQGLGNAFAKLKEKFDATVRSIADGETFQSLARGAIQLADSILKVVKALEPLLPMLSSIAAMQLGKLVVPAFGKFAGIGRNQGGRIHGFNKGGFVPGTGNRDTVPAMLTPGEFVIKKSSVNSIGAQRLAAMNGYTNGGKQPKVAGFDAAKMGALAGMTPTGMLGFKAKPGMVAGLSMNPMGYAGPYSPSKTFTGGNKLPGRFLPAAQRKLVADKYFQGDQKQVMKQMFNYGVLPSSYPIASPQLKQLKTSEFGTIMRTTSSSAIREGVGEAVTRISGQLDLPPALNVNESLLTKAQNTSAMDDQAITTLEGFLYEGVIGALTGAMPTGGHASFDLGLGAFKGNKTRVNKMFGSTVSNALVAEVKRSKGQAASQTGIPKKLYNYIGAAGRSALMSGMVDLAQYNKGGSVDTVPAMLTPGEYVINKSSAQAIGYSNLNRMNKTGVAHFNKGGPVGMNQGGRLQAVGNAAMMTAFMAPMVVEFTNLADETKQLVQQFVMLGGIMAMIGAQTGSALGGFIASMIGNTVATTANSTAQAANTTATAANTGSKLGAAFGILGGAIGLAVGAHMAYTAQLEQERKKMAKSFSEFVMRIKEGRTPAVGEVRAAGQNILGSVQADYALEGMSTRRGTTALSDEALMEAAAAIGESMAVDLSGELVTAADIAAQTSVAFARLKEQLAGPINTVTELGNATLAAAKTIGDFSRETRILAEKGLEGDALIAEQTRIADQFLANARSAKDARDEYDKLAKDHAAGLMTTEQYRTAVQQLNDVTAEQGKVAFQVADTIRSNMQTMVQAAVDGADFDTAAYDAQMDRLRMTLHKGFFEEAIASGMSVAEAQKAATKATTQTLQARRSADSEMIKAAKERRAEAIKLARLEVQLAQAERARAQALQAVNVQFIKFGHATDAAKAALGQITGAIQNVKVTSGDLIATLKDGFNTEGAAALTYMGFGATAGRLRENEAMRTNFEGIIGDPTELMKLEPMERMKEVLNQLGVDAEGVSAEAKEALKKLFEDGFQASDISELMDILGHNVDEVIDAAGKLAKAQQMQVDAIAMFGDAIRKQAQTIRQANMDMVDVIKRGNARLRDAMDIDLSVRDARAEQGMAIGAMLGGNVPMAGANDARAFNFGFANTLQAADIGAAIQKLEEQILMARVDEAFASGDPAAQQEHINKQKLLNQEIANAEEALKLLANQADLAAAVMTEIDKEKSKREAMQKSIENYTFATNDGRRQIDQSFMALQRVLMTGNIEAIPDKMRGAVANLLDQFKDVELIPGMTGDMIKKQLQVRQLDMNFRRMTGGRQGAPPELIKAIFERTDKEDQLIAELQAISQREQDAQAMIREREIAKQEEIRKEAKETNDNLEAMVTELKGAVTALEDMQPARAEPNARGGLVQAFANGGSVFQPRGTDTVPAMLTPGEFVIRKSAVDKIGASTLSAINNGNTSVVYRQNGSTGPERPRTGTGDPMANRLAAGARKGLDYRQSINDPDWMAEQFYKNLDYAMANAPHTGIEDLGAWLDSLIEQNIPMIPGVKLLKPRRKGDLSWAASLGKKRTAETLMGTGMYHTLPADVLGMLGLLGLGFARHSLDPQASGSILSTLNRFDASLIKKVMKNHLVYGSTFLGEPLAIDRGGAGLERGVFAESFGAGALDKFYPTFRNMYVNEKMDTLLDKTLDYREARLDVGRPSMVAAGRRVDLQVMKRRFGMRAMRPGNDFLMKQQALFGITSRIPTVPREYAVKRMREGKLQIGFDGNTLEDMNGNLLPVGISGQRESGSFFADGSRFLLPAHLSGLVDQPFEMIKQMNEEVQMAAQFLPVKFQKMLLQSQRQAVANSHRQGYFRMNQFFGGQAIAGFARGGSVDSVPAMLTPGEFVMSASAVKKHGTGFMNSVNKGKIPGFARGGSVGGVQYRQNGGTLSSMGSGMMDAISKSLSSFEGIANILNNVASLFSNMSISHTIQVDGTLNIPGFSQQAINNIVQVIGDSVVSQTGEKINLALEEFTRKLNQRSD